VLTAGLQADTWNKKTTLTVTEPIEVPSCCTPSHTVILEPGEYVIKLMDSLSDRHIVQVFDKDEQHIITTILAIPNYRLKPTGNTVFQYWEVPAGQPKELRAWFYPGDNFGQEFAYHKQKALEIAAFVKTPVPAIEVDTVAVEELKTVPLVAFDDSGKATELAVTAPEPATPPEPVQTAERAEPAAPAEAPPAAALPQTASSVPLFGLIGLLSLVAFGVLSIRSRRA
jgi:LPXTG-motif cell wall-anchored protein